MRRDHPEAAELVDVRPLPAAPAQVIAALAPLLSAQRLARIEGAVARRTRAVIPVLEAVDDPRNVAAVLRSADAFGVQELQLVESAQPFLAARRVTQGAERWLDLVRQPSPEACVAALHARGFRVYVATMAGELAPEDLRRLDKVAVVFGNEHAGASGRMAALCDGAYTIPMQGLSQSLNVSVAAAITLYAATRGRQGDLCAQEREQLLARFLMSSLPRAEQIVAEQTKRWAR